METKINESLIQETVDLGNEIINELDSSLKSTRETERMVDESIFFHKSAKRVLRGMTWVGYFMNLFSREPVRKDNTTTPIQVNSDPEYVSFDNIDRLVNQSREMNSLLRTQNKELDNLENKIEENNKYADKNLHIISKYNNA
jgi:hypothetical protein